MNKFALAALGAATLSFGLPQAASAQSAYPVDPGDYVEVGMISVDDGHALDYANYLAASYRTSQDFAKAQGWITDYQIWTSVNPRNGEADVYLVTWFPNFADAEEDMRRNQMFLDHMKRTEAQLQAESGKRAEYRKQMGSMLFRVQNWND